MDVPEKLREVLAKDGVVAIATLGQDGPHMANTWNSYVRLKATFGWMRAVLTVTMREAKQTL